MVVGYHHCKKPPYQAFLVEARKSTIVMEKGIDWSCEGIVEIKTTRECWKYINTWGEDLKIGDKISYVMDNRLDYRGIRPTRDHGTTGIAGTGTVGKVAGTNGTGEMRITIGETLGEIKQSLHPAPLQRVEAEKCHKSPQMMLPCSLTKGRRVQNRKTKIVVLRMRPLS